MQILESYNEYKDMIREFREKNGRPFSNVYYVPEDIERYIRLGRAGFERTESGIIFYFDEEKYYRVCLYVNEKERFSIEKRDKKILLKNVFQEGKKRENLLCVEQRLEELGFKKAGTSFKIRGEVKKLFQRCERMKKFADVLEKKGFHCVAAEFSMLEEIEALILDSGVIKDYQLNYWTDEEKKRMIKEGSYLCMVNDKKQICAVGGCIIKNNTTKGVAVAVREEYKMHGLIVALAYHRLKWLYDNGFESCQGWILTSNEPSIRYYQSLGYEFLNEYTDEWILEADKGYMDEKVGNI